MDWTNLELEIFDKFILTYGKDFGQEFIDQLNELKNQWLIYRNKINWKKLYKIDPLVAKGIFLAFCSGYSYAMSNGVQNHGY